RREREVPLRKAKVTGTEDMERVARDVVRPSRRIDVLVNTIGGYMSGSVEATTDEEFDRAIALNLKSTFLACRAVIPAMRKAKRGKIVNVSSESSLLGEAESFLYSAGKSGVNRLTESLARELNTATIQGNGVMPRILDTPA